MRTILLIAIHFIDYLKNRLPFRNLFTGRTHREPKNRIMSKLLDEIFIKPGDIIFLSIPNALYRRVAETTGSKASHVGIVFYDVINGWVVAESTIPCVKYTPLEEFFLSHTDNHWVAVRRLKTGLSSLQVQQLRMECDLRVGKLYHLGFCYNSPRQFCSKLVYDVYLVATGIKIGTLEPFSELLRRKQGTSLLFWRLWFFGAIPWSRTTVTPASQMESEMLETVF